VRQPRLTQALLCTVAVLLALNLAVGLANGPSPSAGLVQTAHAQGTTNSAQQREQMIAQLKAVSAKLDAVSAKLDGTLTVRVEGGVDIND